MNFFGIGPLEILLILALALIVFGPDKLPEMARQAGLIYRGIQRIRTDVTREVHQALDLEDAPKPPPGSQARAPQPNQPPPPPQGSARRDRDIEPPY